MFATGVRGRQQYQSQRESPPEPGCDSSYGVRSLNGSVQWASGAEGAESGDDNGPSTDDMVVESQLVPVEGSQSDIEEGDHNHDATPLIPQTHLSASPPTSDLPLDPSPSVTSSPEDTLRPTHPSPRSFLDPLPDLEGTSEPSSPASYTSLPSYVASLSSLSRMSSPMAGIDLDGEGYLDEGAEGMEGLVLPMLNLPSESLHASASGFKGKELVGDADGTAGGVVIVILGEIEVVDGLIGELRGSGEVLERRDGEVRIVRDGKIWARLIIGLDGDQVYARVTDAYANLHSLLHPVLRPGLRDKMDGLVDGYSRKNDWVHLVLDLGDDLKATKSLSSIVPVASPHSSQTGLFASLNLAARVDTLRRQTPSPPHLDDPTPMPHDQSSEYFAPHDSAPSPPDLTADHLPVLLALLSSGPQIHSASTSKFISWRSHQLQSSYSTSPTSSSYEAGPMPTVARAQGGAEWEATLSRRIARRREVTDGASKPTRGRARKRGTSRSQERVYHPLFPRKGLPVRGITSVGLSDLMESVFSGVKTPWRWGLVAAFAIAVGVGVGFWSGAVRASR